MDESRILLAIARRCGLAIEVGGSRAAIAAGAQLGRLPKDWDLCFPDILEKLIQEEKQRKYFGAIETALKDVIEGDFDDELTLRKIDSYGTLSGEAGVLTVEGSIENLPFSLDFDIDTESLSLLSKFAQEERLEKGTNQKHKSYLRFRSLEEVLGEKIFVLSECLEDSSISTLDMKHLSDAANIIRSSPIDADKCRHVFYKLLSKVDKSEFSVESFPKYGKAYSNYREMCKRQRVQNPLSYDDAAQLWTAFNIKALAADRPGQMWVPERLDVVDKSVIPPARMPQAVVDRGTAAVAAKLNIKTKSLAVQPSRLSRK